MIRAQDPQPRFNITGDKGSYIKFGLDPQEGEMRVWKPESGRIVGDDKWGFEEEEMYGELQTVKEGKLVKEKYVAYRYNGKTNVTDFQRIVQVPLACRIIPKHLPEPLYRHPGGQGKAHRQAGTGRVDDEDHRACIPELEGGSNVEGRSLRGSRDVIWDQRVVI
jgi:hypothetical protein